MSQTIDLMMKHASVRKFTEEPIPAGEMTQIIDAGRAASSWKAFRPYTIIDVTSAEVKEALFELVPQPAIKGCSSFLIFVGDLTVAQKACQMHDGTFQPGGVETLLITSVDAALAAQNTLLAAESLGYGGVFIGLIRYKSAEIAELLGLPEYSYPVFGVAIGRPARTFAPKPHLPHEVVVHQDRYTPVEGLEDAIRQHDADYAEYFGGRAADDWSERVVAQWGVPEDPSSTDRLRAAGLL
ncbi:MAG: nitroreductase family protein [Promicromonosporaceae bacterium]|nr:nitroreductase family protein [Promicromonosporaceae bacterium]